MTDILSYLKNPFFCENKKPQVVDLLYLLIIYLLAIIPIGIIAFMICNTLKITHKEINLTPWMKLLVGVILAPIYEEIIFRSLLKFKRINVVLFLITISAFILYYIIKSKIEVALFLSILLLCFISILIFYSRNQIESFISSRFKYFFYATILLFGLLHTFNFTGNIYALLAFSFILGGPQLVLGYILGYIRMNHGLVYSILFHMIVNSSIIFPIITKL